ncbi:MAG: XdhC family protein [Candidatus Polarisedimenticolaceae bacterium]|nr:XdhC family protein [Candidatus Polarisedimenticolaceae bacterium]
MQGSDLHTLLQGLEWLGQGHRIKLVTVIKTSGTTPRPVGSIAIFSDQGQIAGSVSGGCVEEELLESLVNDSVDKPRVIDYGIPQQGAIRRGLPCGGRMQLLAEPLHDLNELTHLVDMLKQRRLVLRHLNLTTGQSQIESVSQSQPFKFIANESTSHCFGPSWRMLLIGANELSRQLAQIAQTLDYVIEVCDPRTPYQEAWNLPNIELVQQIPDEFVQHSKPDIRTLVITLAHDPRIDDLALIEALKTNCFYVGALGSCQTNQQRRERLAEFLTPDELQRLHGPVGLVIGSRTPAEIAIAILAEVTALRNGKLIRS